MDQIRVAFVLMAINETQWEGRNADGRPRHLSTEELDARADVVWRWTGAKRALAAWVRGLTPHWRPRASTPIAPMDLPSVDATAQG